MNRCSRRVSTRLFAAASLLALAVVAGCTPKPQAAVAPPQGYFGPTETMAEVVAAINARNNRIPTLWARGDSTPEQPQGGFDAEIVQKNATGDVVRRDTVNGSVILLYDRPDNLRIVGKKDVLGEAFDVGTNRDRYWLWTAGRQSTLWWGDYADLGNAEAARQMPIEPYLLIEVLGIGTFGADFLREPMPVMRFNNDADAYMFVWHVRGGDRLVAQKEVWYDRQTKLPKLVLLFDEDGRIVLRAYLSNFRDVEGTTGGDGGGAAAQVASRYRLFFPDSGSRMTFELTDIRLRRGSVPNAGSFRFDADSVDAAEVIRIR